MTHFLLATVFTLFGAGCAMLVLFGLPGGWLMLGSAVAIELLDHHVSGVPHVTFGWGWLMAVGVVRMGASLVPLMLTVSSAVLLNALSLTLTLKVSLRLLPSFRALSVAGLVAA